MRPVVFGAVLAFVLLYAVAVGINAYEFATLDKTTSNIYALQTKLVAAQQMDQFARSLVRRMAADSAHDQNLANLLAHYGLKVNFATPPPAPASVPAPADPSNAAPASAPAPATPPAPAASPAATPPPAQ